MLKFIALPTKSIWLVRVRPSPHKNGSRSYIAHIASGIAKLRKKAQPTVGLNLVGREMNCWRVVACKVSVVESNPTQKGMCVVQYCC